MRPMDLAFGFLDNASIAPPAASRSERTGKGQSDAGAGALRALDLAVAAAALVVVLPMMMLIAALIRIQDGGPAFFAHRRIGKDGRTFACLKFRTMVMGAEDKLQALLAQSEAARCEWAADHKLRDDPRVTALGLLLRKSSFDELPQLFNVLRGEMSIVGPRPIVDGEVDRYGRRYRHYCSVRPGITGLWQVSGRNDVSYRRRVACDVLYAQRRSLTVNLKIIVGTLPAVWRARGCY